MVNVSVVIPTIHTNDVQLERCKEILFDQGINWAVHAGGTFSENCNVGAAASEMDIVVFLNEDTEPRLGWLQPLIDPIVRDPTVGITGAKLVYPDGTIQHAGVYIGMEDGLLTARNVCWNAPSGPIIAVTGACMAVRRSLFEALGGFDELFRSGYEDVDLCLRASNAGFQTVYIAESVVIHHESQSGPERWRYVRENVQRLQEKWNVGYQGGDSEAIAGTDGR